MEELDDETILVRDFLCNRPTGPRTALRQKPTDEFKVTELPEFTGGTDPEDYLEWERNIERMFEFKNLSDEKSCKYAILKLSRGASLWFENLKSQRTRAGKSKISSWESLKRKLRKRYVPPTHRLDVYRKIADLTQGKLSVGQYIDEFERLAMMGELEEKEELKMSRFLRGLNRSIANIVELHPYSDFDTLCGLCLKVEAQGRNRFGSNDLNKVVTWSKTNVMESGGSCSGTTVVQPVDETVTPATVTKPAANSKEQSVMKVRCFKCQGFGHYQNACPNKRNIALREAVSVRDELLEEETVAGLFNLNMTDEGKEHTEIYEAPIYDTCLVIRSLQSNSESSLVQQREQLFHTKCLVNDRWCSVIVDGGSCTNAASTEMVSKLALSTMAHPEPYALHWLNDGKKVQVSKQVRIGLTMGSYKDEILCDVIPMDACHILLGRPWQYDRDVVHRGRSNEYELLDKGKRIILRPLPSEAMHSGRKKRSSLAISAMDEDLVFELGTDNNIAWSIDFNRPPVFDDYGDEETIFAYVKEPCFSVVRGFKFEFGSNTSKGANYYLNNFYLNEFKETKLAATLVSLSCWHRVFGKEVRERLAMIVPGGRRGGWHKGVARSLVEKKLIDDSGVSMCLSWLLVFFILFTLLLVLSFLDPGGVMLQELRSILFKGGGDDPKMTRSNIGMDEVAVDVKSSEISIARGS